MVPQTPAYRAVPHSPQSALSTPDTLVDSTPHYPVGPRSSNEFKSSRLLQSPLPKRWRLRPLPVLFAILGLLLVAGPILHPTPRSAIHSYISSTSSSFRHGSSSGYLGGVQPATGGLDPAIVPMTLEARLSYLLSRPALDHPMAELTSRYQCPFQTYNRDWYFFHNGKVEQWTALTGGDVMRYRNKMVEYLRTVEREGGKLVWEDGMDSHVPVDQRRGLIFTAGDGVSSCDCAENRDEPLE